MIKVICVEYFTTIYNIRIHCLFALQEGIRKIHLERIKLQRKNKQFRQIQEGEKEKPEVTVHILVNSLLELKIFAGDKNKTLAHVVNTAYNHNAVSKDALPTLKCSIL